MTEQITEIDTLVVGAGQAGVAMSEHLTRLDIPHLVLEKQGIAQAWRSGRWDSLVANGPAWHDRFPGMVFPDCPADSFVGKEQVADYFAAYARSEINAIGDYYAYGSELVNGDSIYAFDTTKLSVNTLGIGLAGIEVYDLLRDEYNIQIEFGDLGNILAYISVGDKTKNVERLISALAELRRLYKNDNAGMFESEYISPEVVLSPQTAFYAPKRSLPLKESIGEVCTEFVMCYPPGIPVLAPGERITSDIVDYINYAREKGCLLTGPESMDASRLNVLEKGEADG